MRNVRTALVALSLALVPCGAFAQDPPAGGGRGGRAAEPEIKPFDRVITRDAKSDDGIFTVHRLKDRVFYEIPKDKLGREFLWVSQIAKTRSEEHTSELQSHSDLVCRLLLEKKKKK